MYNCSGTYLSSEVMINGRLTRGGRKLFRLWFACLGFLTTSTSRTHPQSNVVARYLLDLAVYSATG